MFSYRHAFHAGNHADVLKHLTLIAALRHLMRKDSPLTLIDTHAGAGLYRLDDDVAATSGEAAEGYLRLRDWANARAAGLAAAEKTPSAGTHKAHPATETVADAVRDYLGVVQQFNPTGGARVYPGSPFVIWSLMDEAGRRAVHDRLRLFEWHPSDIHALQGNVEQLEAGRRIGLQHEDGFKGLRALLPPPPAPGGSRRALVLVDPSYELKTDYARVAEQLQDALRRFATGTYLVWYPVIPRPEAHELPRRLRTLARQAGREWLDVSLNIGHERAASAPGPGAPRPGLSASGMFIVNPPFSLRPALEAALPQLLAALGRGAGQAWSLEAG